MEREPSVTLLMQENAAANAAEKKSTREHDRDWQHNREETVLENGWARFNVFDLSLEEVKRRPRRARSFGERQRTQEVRQRGACSNCRASKRKVCL